MSNTKRIGFLATGSEIVSGEIVNTNSQKMSEQLFGLGVEVGEHLCVDDGEANMHAGLKFLVDRHDLVITTGGLGPTSDDRTRNIIADLFDLPLLFDQATWDYLVVRIQARGFPVTENNKQQAYFPQGAVILKNHNGSANACLLEVKYQGVPKTIFMLPGPPAECMPIFEEHIVPYVKANDFVSDKKLYRWRVEHIGESRIADVLDQTIGKQYGIDIAYRAVKQAEGVGYVDVKLLLSPCAKTDEIVKNLDQAIQDLNKQYAQ